MYPHRRYEVPKKKLNENQNWKQNMEDIATKLN